jgi:hypothetical protein
MDEESRASMKKHLLVAASLLAATAWAQEAAVATKIDGLVTASQAGTVALVRAGSPLIDGARVLTGSSGHAEFEVGRNCKVILEPNQALTIDAEKTCPDLIASIEDLSNSHLAGLLQDRGFLASLPGWAPLAIAATGAGAVISSSSGRNRPLSGQ